jgi:hypothetical protein
VTDSEQYPQPPPPPPQPEEPPRKRRRRWPWVVGGIVVVVIVAAIAAGGADEYEPSATDETTTTVEEADGATATTATVPLAPEHVTVDLVVLSQECFGSAGCNISFDIEVELAASARLAAGQRWQVTYEVHGVEDPPYIDTFTIISLNDDDFEYEWYEGFVSTPPNPALTATVTRVVPEP